MISLKKAEPNAAPLIIVADDDPPMRLLLVSALEADGYEVLGAADGREVIQLCEKHNPSLVLMDAIMPVIDGFDACRHLSHLAEEIRPLVLMITSLDDDASVEMAFNAGAYDFVTKPIQWAVLKQRVKRLLQMKAADWQVHSVAEQLRQSEARIRMVLNNILDGMVTLNHSWHIESINPAAERIFGVTKAEIFGKPIHSLIAADPINQQRLQAYIEDLKQQTNGDLITVDGLHKTGSVFPLELALSEASLGEETYYVGSLRDISQRQKEDQERQQLQKQLQQAQGSYRASLPENPQAS